MIEVLEGKFREVRRLRNRIIHGHPIDADRAWDELCRVATYFGEGSFLWGLLTEPEPGFYTDEKLKECILKFDRYLGREISLMRELEVVNPFENSQRDAVVEGTLRAVASEDSHIRVTKPPGWKLKRLADFAFSRATFENVFDPVMRDLQYEFELALSEGRTRKAEWVRLRGYWSFWSAVAAQLPISLAKRIYEIWRAAG